MHALIYTRISVSEEKNQRLDEELQSSRAEVRDSVREHAYSPRSRPRTPAANYVRHFLFSFVFIIL